MLIGFKLERRLLKNLNTYKDLGEKNAWRKYREDYNHFIGFVYFRQSLRYLTKKQGEKNGENSTSC